MALTRRQQWTWGIAGALVALLVAALLSMEVATVRGVVEKRCGMCGRVLQRDWYVVRLWGLRLELPIIGETVGGSDRCPHGWQTLRPNY
jgi:hypothetical protein